MTSPFTKREPQVPDLGALGRRIGRDAALVTGLSLLLGLLGPFGTFYDLDRGERILYWALGIGLMSLQIGILDALFRRLTAVAAWPIWLRAVAVALLASLPGAFEILMLEQMFRPRADLPATLIGVVTIYPYVALVTLGINVPVTLLQERKVPAEPDASGPPPTAVAGVASLFERRIPAHLGTRLLALEMEDHYLRIHTDQGSDLVLCRLSDAVAELEGTDGLQVHRSFWVARKGLAAVRREEAKVTLLLENGLEVPVSRTYLPAVRAAGWLLAAKKARS